MFADRASEEFSVFVFVPNKYTKRITVRKGDACGTLKNIFGHDNTTFLYKGQSLNFDSTFGDYNITNRDSIIALDSGCESTEISKWMSLSRDADDLNDALRKVMSQSSRGEFLRKMDMSSMRLELKPRAFRRLVTRCMNREESGKVTEHVTVMAPTPSTIRTEPLPLPPGWAD